MRRAPHDVNPPSTMDPRRARRAARCALAVTAAAALLLAACGEPDPETLPPPAVPSAQPTGSAGAAPGGSAAARTGKAADPTSTAKPATGKPAAPEPAADPAVRKPPAKRSVVPDDLVGAWRSITERGNAFSYEFTADGKYLYNGIMQDGDLRYTLQEGGRASVSGDVITFRPQQTVMTRTQNGASTTTKPQRPARQATFAVDGNSLTFTEADGSGSVYERG